MDNLTKIEQVDSYNTVPKRERELMVVNFYDNNNYLLVEIKEQEEQKLYFWYNNKFVVSAPCSMSIVLHVS